MKKDYVLEDNLRKEFIAIIALSYYYATYLTVQQIFHILSI